MKSKIRVISKRIIEQYDKNPTRLMDILIETQKNFGHVPKEAMLTISDELDVSLVEVEQTLTFYHFLSEEPVGKYTVYLNDSAVSNMMGRQGVKNALEKELGIKFGQVTEDGLIGLFDTACIGMNDQEPAAIINNRVFTNLTPFRVRELIRDIRSGKDVKNMFMAGWGDGKNSDPLIHAVVQNNIRKQGKIIFSDYNMGDITHKLVQKTPEEIIECVKSSNIRGRGGAGFPTGLKWELCKRNDVEERYIFCNADEGEPGTFKDRVILTERPGLIFEGMTTAGYSIGAKEGILYLRYEYKYLQEYLENVLQEMRNMNILGDKIAGKEDFNFDIRIQFGAGAYVCGEESALIESAEGKRGEPRDRPPFPVEVGYLGKPTVVNNVETLCNAAKLIQNGIDWYRSIGTTESSGSKLLSISGDCKYPGVYEIEWGFNINDILDMVGIIETPQAVQIGGPSGTLIGSDDFNRRICYNDLSTGGSIIVIGQHRDILKDIVLNFTEFFIEESCGSCAPCRMMTVLLRNKLKKILDGNGIRSDLKDIEDWGKVMKTNRCGLGQTAANPILNSLHNFPHLYEEHIQETKDFDSGFDLEYAISESSKIAGREKLEMEVS